MRKDSYFKFIIHLVDHFLNLNYIRLSLERVIFLTFCGVVTASLASLVLGIIMLLVIAGKSTYIAVDISFYEVA